MLTFRKIFKGQVLQTLKLWKIVSFQLYEPHLIRINISVQVQAKKRWDFSAKSVNRSFINAFNLINSKGQGFFNGFQWVVFCLV